MCVCIRCCLATVVAAAVIFVPQFEASPIASSSLNSSQMPKQRASETEEITAKPSKPDTVGGKPHQSRTKPRSWPTASDDKSNIARISVAASAGLQHSALGPASQRHNSPVPEHEVLQEETGDSTGSGTAAEKTQGLISQAISDPTLHSETPDQLATKAMDNNAGTVQLVKGKQLGHDKVNSSQTKIEDAKKNVVQEFSITEVTKPKPEAASLPATPQVQNTPPDHTLRTEPPGPHGEAASTNKQTKVAASDDKSNIPRISVAASRGPQHSAPVPASQGHNSPVPAQEVLQEETGDSSVSDKAANKTQGLISQAISDPTLHSETPDQLATKAMDNNAGTVQLVKGKQLGHDTVNSSQTKIEDAKKNVVQEFSITEVTKHKPDAHSFPATPQVQNKTPPDNTLRAKPQGPHGEAESTNKQTKEAESQINVAATTITKMIKPAAGSAKATPHVEPVDPKGPPSETNHIHTAGDTVQQINMMSVTDMIKPVAGSSAATPPLEPGPRTVNTAAAVTEVDVVKHSTINEAKGAVPKINVSVTKMDKPVAVSSAASPQTQPASRTATVTEADHEKRSTDKEAKDPAPQITKMIKPVASSSAASPQTEPAPRIANPGATVSEAEPLKHFTNKEAKALATERSISHPPGGQLLTTIIKPVHAARPEVGNKATQNKNITPVFENPSNVLGEDGGSESPKDKKPNAYTITPNEFAKKTAFAHAQKLEEESKESSAAVSESTIHSSHLNIETGTAATTSSKTEVQITPTKGQDNKSNTNESKTPTDKTIGTKNKGDENKEQLTKIAHDTVEEGKPLKSSNHSENLNSMTVSELVNKTSNELKSFREEVTNNWNERREKISWLGEATEVLQTYNNKITELEKYSKCPTDDRKEYEKRKDRLKSIIDSCEVSLKRKDWHELEEKTSKKLSEIRAVKEDYDAQISQIPKEDEQYNARKLVIEENAIRKLKELNSESIKNDFSKLKNNALQIDEEDYQRCIDNKETKETGNSIIKDTRIAIMKLHDCV